ncbi:MAG: hypothetical protein HQL53_02325 [Magnetococcales bacterium]|nr:hypothetical protein [Magnetococcales bacterium]
MQSSKTIIRSLFFIMFLSVVLLSVMAKTVAINDPHAFADHTSRRMQTMSIVDDYYVNGVDLLRPKTNYAGWPGYLVLEFPLFQAMAAWTAKITGHTLTAARWLNLAIGTFSLLIAYWITLTTTQRTAAAQYAVVMMAFSPLHMRYHPSGLVDVLGAMLCLSAYLLLLKYLKNPHRGVLTLLIVMSAVGLVIKPLYYFPVALLYLMHFFNTIPAFTPRAILSAVFHRERTLVVTFLFLIGVLAGWLYTVKLYDVSQVDHISHLGELTLANYDARFFVTIGQRVLLMFVNPVGSLLFLIGAVLIWKKWRLATPTALVLCIPLYYIIFPSINKPHDYYSMAVTPFAAIVAGYGAMWLEDQLVTQGAAWAKYTLRMTMFTLIAAISVMVFILNIVTGTANLASPYRAAAKELTPVMEPYQHTVAFLNREADYSLEQYMLHDRGQYIMFKLGMISVEQIHQRPPKHILSTPQLFYAIKQYGHSSRVPERGFEMDVDLLQSQYEGHLRYMLFYRFDPAIIAARMQGRHLIHQSSDWLVYDLNPSSSNR